jgi:hypothetical protein
VASRTPRQRKIQVTRQHPEPSLILGCPTVHQLDFAKQKEIEIAREKSEPQSQMIRKR